jgi:hypothetical protein
MDGFFDYNQIQIFHADQYKIEFTTPWGTFSYWIIPFGIKPMGATFQQAMTYAFHDLSHIILSYLDDLTAHSKKHSQHIEDLHLVFQCCHRYNI